MKSAFLITLLLIAAATAASASEKSKKSSNSKSNNPGGWFGPGGGGYNEPGWGNLGGGYGGGYGGPGGGYAHDGVVRPSVVCTERGPCYKKKLTCPAKCFSSYSRAGRNYGGGGGGGGCTMDCKKKCVAYC